MTQDEREIAYLDVARIVAANGLKGEVKAQVLTDFPQRFALLKTVFVGEDFKPYDISSASIKTKGKATTAYLKLAGIDTREDAEKLRGQMVRIPMAEAMPLEEDQYYWHQILDLEVWTTDGQHIGRIVDILERPANDVYVVAGEQGEVLIPAIEEVVMKVDLKEGRMTINPLPGLLD